MGPAGAVAAAGTPPIQATRFDYGDEELTVALKPTLGVSALYAPRRTLLDRLLVDAAAAAGAQVRFGVRVTDVCRDAGGRVTGVRTRDRLGVTAAPRARLVVGADGLRSAVAGMVGAPTRHRGSSASAVVYGYWSQLPTCGYEWCYGTGHSGGFIPTNDGQVCVFAASGAQRLTGPARAALPETYRSWLAAAAPRARERLAAAKPPRRLHTWVGQPGLVRQARGPGWALIGDAGSFLDPLSTHGITDALRDAQLLSRSVADAGRSAHELDAALEAFAATRDRVVDGLFPPVDALAGYRWDAAGVRGHLLELSTAMGVELELLSRAARESVPATGPRQVSGMGH